MTESRQQWEGYKCEFNKFCCLAFMCPCFAMCQASDKIGGKGSKTAAQFHGGLVTISIILMFVFLYLWYQIFNYLLLMGTYLTCVDNAGFGTDTDVACKTEMDLAQAANPCPETDFMCLLNMANQYYNYLYIIGAIGFVIQFVSRGLILWWVSKMGGEMKTVSSCPCCINCLICWPFGPVVFHCWGISAVNRTADVFLQGGGVVVGSPVSATVVPVGNKTSDSSNVASQSAGPSTFDLIRPKWDGPDGEKVDWGGTDSRLK